MKKGTRKKAAVGLGANVGEVLAQAQETAKQAEVATLSTEAKTFETVAPVLNTETPAPAAEAAAPEAMALVDTPPVAVVEPAPAPKVVVPKPVLNRRFVGIYMHKPESSQPGDVVYNVAPHDPHSVPALTGVLLVGPKHMHQSTDRGLVPHGVRAYRFVVNHGRIGKGRDDRNAPIASKPSLSPDWYVRLACACGNTEVVLNHQTFEKDFLERWKQEPRGKFDRRLCPNCGKSVSKDNISCTLLPTEAGYAVFQRPDDPILQAFEQSWIDSDGTVGSILPRLWCLYPVKRTPFDWAPTDQLAKEIDARARKGKGCTIRPFRDSYRSKSPHIDSIYCEAFYTLRCGWVEEADLDHNSQTDKEFGYTRQFGHEPELSGF